ncbi:MAG: hypothetical protein WCL51_12205 [Bacteroidota bacterium]
MKTHNKIKQLLVFIILIMIPVVNFAQNGQRLNKIKDKINAQKVAYITKELDLTPQEAQQFWPVYNEFETQRKAINKDFKGQNIEERQIDFNTLSDKDALEMADNHIILAQKVLDLRKKYHAEFKKILPAKKLLKLYQAEKDFNKFLLKEIKERQGNRRLGN